MTPNKEDYLKEIYKLGNGGGEVSNKQISDILHISPASVSEMLLKLSNDGLQKSTTLLRSHRLWEVFLVQHLGYPWEEVHEDAEVLEHVTTPRLAKRLDNYLKHPSFCPHGSAIPESNGKIKILPLRTLNQLSVGEKTYIRRVTEETELLEYLHDLGIEIGSHLTVVSMGAYEGPLTLDFDGKEVQISYKAACHIYVDAV